MIILLLYREKSACLTRWIVCIVDEESTASILMVEVTILGVKGKSVEENEGYVFRNEAEGNDIV